MSQKSLGLIETYGLLAGIEAADAAVKSANVQLIGYEFAKGSGMTTIKVEGDVGAVKAAIAAAQVSVEKIGRVASVKVIPRPAEGLEMLVRNEATVGYTPPEPPQPPTPPTKPEPTPAAPKAEEKKQVTPVEEKAEATSDPIGTETAEQAEAPTTPEVLVAVEAIAESEAVTEPETAESEAPAEAEITEEIAESAKDATKKNRKNKRKG